VADAAAAMSFLFHQADLSGYPVSLGEYPVDLGGPLQRLSDGLDLLLGEIKVNDSGFTMGSTKGSGLGLHTFEDSVCQLPVGLASCLQKANDDGSVLYAKTAGYHAALLSLG
jgi:hypothetical protein